MLHCVRACCALSVCNLFFLGGQGDAECMITNGSDHVLSLTIFSDFPREARECPEASPLTSHASCFLTAMWASVRLGAPSTSRNPVG